MTTEIIALRQETDLDYEYVLRKIMDELLPVKMFDVDKISERTIEEWYREFLKRKWNKKLFDTQLDRIKATKIYGGIDLNQWLECEVMYSEHDFKVKVDKKIEQLLQEGERLQRLQELGKLEATPPEDKLIKMNVARNLQRILFMSRYNVLQDVLEKATDRIKRKLQRYFEIDTERRYAITQKILDILDTEIEDTENG